VQLHLAAELRKTGGSRGNQYKNNYKADEDSHENPHSDPPFALNQG
jgi:hypothetical protein